MSVVEIAVTLGGLGVIGFLAWFFFGPRQAQAARVKGNVQEIVVTRQGWLFAQCNSSPKRCPASLNI